MEPSSTPLVEWRHQPLTPAAATTTDTRIDKEHDIVFLTSRGYTREQAAQVVHLATFEQQQQQQQHKLNKNNSREFSVPYSTSVESYEPASVRSGLSQAICQNYSMLPLNIHTIIITIGGFARVLRNSSRFGQIQQYTFAFEY